MRIRVFELERVQSLYENAVEFNLTESGFHPLTLREVLSADELERLRDTSLGYAPTNGSQRLRSRIAALYGSADRDGVLVTNGSAEANFVACRTLLEPGDEVVMMVPNYMQIWGLVEEIGATPRPFPLRESDGWRPDMQALRAAVGGDTKMIAVCNPNNPTGATLTEDEMDEVLAVADSVGAWVYADEVYRGAEVDSRERPSFAGRGERVLVCGGLSKAYALPGLRLGWLCGPREVISECWAYHDYTTIAAGVLSNQVAEIVLEPATRRRVLERNRALLRTNLELVEAWLDGWHGLFRWVPPEAGSMVFTRYDLDASSGELSDWLRTEKGVFVLAGEVFDLDGFIRLGIGSETAYLDAALERLREGLEERFGV